MLGGIEKRLGFPPLTRVLDLLAGPTGRRVEKLLDRLEALSKDDSLPQVQLLLEQVERMGQSGTLAQLDSILKGLPKGKQGEVMMGQLATLLKELGPRLDKLTHLADALLKE